MSIINTIKDDRQKHSIPLQEKNHSW